MSELSFAEVRRAVIVTLERAADTLRRLSMPLQAMPSIPRASWPDAPNAPSDAYGYGEQPLPLIPPRPRAISELDRVLPWLADLDSTERRLVWARAARVPWPRLAREFGLAVGQLRYRWEGAIDRVVAAAVRESHAPPPAVRESLAPPPRRAGRRTSPGAAKPLPKSST
jgi:hypothetical protein